jgi:PAS domain S-box-containing protein
MSEPVRLTYRSNLMHMLDKLPAVVFEYSVFPDGSRDFTYISPRCEEILGVNQEILMRGILPMKNFIYHEDWSGFYESTEQSLADLQEWKWEGRLNSRGEVIWIEAIGQPSRMPDGVVVCHGIITDITQRKMLEQRSRDADKKYRELVEHMRKTEMLFSQLFQNSPMAIVILDDKGNVVQINQGFEELFGYTIDELKGHGLNAFIVPDELEAEGNDLNSLISSYKVIRIETIRRRRDGEMLSLIVYGVPVHMEDKTIGIFGVYVDITEQKKIEKELKIRNTELDNFVYKVSHDLRAPLSSILGLVNLANMPGNDDSLGMYMSLIGRKVEQLDHFISDVLSHSKNLKQDLTIEQVDMGQIIANTFTDLSYLKDTEQIAKEIDIQGTEFYSDRWRLAEIFRNLISNAIKYRRMDIEKPTIRVSVKVNEQEAEISFSDNGIGIEPDKLLNIFEMFYRASTQSDGSGLGLYIVKNAVEKLGGQIDVFSRPLQGTEFKILLPNQRLPS